VVGLAVGVVVGLAVGVVVGLAVGVVVGLAVGVVVGGISAATTAGDFTNRRSTKYAVLRSDFRGNWPVYEYTPATAVMSPRVLIFPAPRTFRL
jgi:outer membrane lipoprotein SlyB